jgi:cellulose synthase/poly-beta-1,6-N-acetylglucosamine synthase-like glycosyltransferase
LTTIDNIPQLLFWVGISVPLYAYLGYPAVLALLRLLIRRPVRKKPFEPYVSLLIPAYNEAASIERKVRNCLTIDYPPSKLEIVIACDGCTDGTGLIAARAAAGTSIRVLDFPDNSGKIGNLNRSVPLLHNDILVFSDAAAFLYPNSIRQLVISFADPEVGAVSGKYTVVKADQVDIGVSEDFYWRYETWLKVQESDLSSTLGGHGHLHAIRRALYPFPPPGTINDDYVIPVSVLSRGLRAVYEPAAIVYEEAQEMAGFGRRVRIMAGNIQQMRELKGLLSPFRALPLFFFLSHKVCRLAVPLCMLVALLANLLLLRSPLYGALAVLQALFYALAAAGARWQLRPRILLLPWYFCMINAAVFVAMANLLTHRRTAWK